MGECVYLFMYVCVIGNYGSGGECYEFSDERGEFNLALNCGVIQLQLYKGAAS